MSNNNTNLKTGKEYCPHFPDKRSYSEETAIELVENGFRTSYYPCDGCGKYHVTSMMEEDYYVRSSDYSMQRPTKIVDGVRKVIMTKEEYSLLSSIYHKFHDMERKVMSRLARNKVSRYIERITSCSSLLYLNKDDKHSAEDMAHYRMESFILMHKTSTKMTLDGTYLDYLKSVNKIATLYCKSRNLEQRAIASLALTGCVIDIVDGVLEGRGLEAWRQVVHVSDDSTIPEEGTSGIYWTHTHEAFRTTIADLADECPDLFRAVVGMINNNKLI